MTTKASSHKNSLQSSCLKDGDDDIYVFLRWLHVLGITGSLTSGISVAAQCQKYEIFGGYLANSTDWGYDSKLVAHFFMPNFYYLSTKMRYCP